MRSFAAAAANRVLLQHHHFVMIMSLFFSKTSGHAVMSSALRVGVAVVYLWVAARMPNLRASNTRAEPKQRVSLIGYPPTDRLGE